MQRHKVEGKYKILNRVNDLVFDTDDLGKFIDQCRTYMGKPNTERSKDYYENNKFNIKLALKDAKTGTTTASGENVKSLQKLIDIYEVSNDE
jgi:hypothetical protein